MTAAYYRACCHWPHLRCLFETGAVPHLLHALLHPLGF